MFQTNVVQKIKTRFMFNNLFFPKKKTRRLLDNVERYCTAGQAKD